uniref:Uncharacterized protein n=1 Tax=Ralstonia solanacearum TaxID=305 RepID=A0A0S4U337_RALSL|nr:protein of unknown function [Ralstonia solanacearum]
MRPLSRRSFPIDQGGRFVIGSITYQIAPWLIQLKSIQPVQ